MAANNSNENKAVQVLLESVRATIRRAKRRGTIGMSADCLRANTSTSGLRCSVAEYRAAWELVCELPDVRRFLVRR